MRLPCFSLGLVGATDVICHRVVVVVAAEVESFAAVAGRVNWSADWKVWINQERV
ncbi:MAG: hypothetical protein FWD57_03895 [Polyangiaceae bacterium]|nr:hypothetical protein [Polyangiaceae bacterium]